VDDLKQFAENSFSRFGFFLVVMAEWRVVHSVKRNSCKCRMLCRKGWIGHYATGRTVVHGTVNQGVCWTDLFKCWYSKSKPMVLKRIELYTKLKLYFYQCFVWNSSM
jgi:hypothetical protein